MFVNMLKFTLELHGTLKYLRQLPLQATFYWLVIDKKVKIYPILQSDIKAKDSYLAPDCVEYSIINSGETRN